MPHTLTPAAYRKLIRRRSGLPPTLRLVAGVLADLRYDEQLTNKPHMPLEVTTQQIADESGLHRQTVIKALVALRDAGWLRVEEVYRDGRQRPSRYWLTDPDGRYRVSDGHPEGEVQSSPALLSTESRQSPKNGDYGYPVLRSKYKGDAHDAAPSGGVGNAEQENLQTGGGASPDPALGGAGPDDAGDPIADAFHRDWDEEREAERRRTLAYHPVNVDCPHCERKKGQTCRRVGTRLDCDWHDARRHAAMERGRALSEQAS